jgi:hypothetical protein
MVEIAIKDVLTPLVVAFAISICATPLVSRLAFKIGAVDIPKDSDVLYALCSAMLVYARAHKDDTRLIANSIAYADRMPPDFSAVVLKDYMYIEKDYRLKLMRVPQFERWMRTKGRLLNGSV